MWILLGIIDDSSLGNIDIDAAPIFMRWYGQSLCVRQLEAFDIEPAIAMAVGGSVNT